MRMFSHELPGVPLRVMEALIVELPGQLTAGVAKIERNEAFGTWEVGYGTFTSVWKCFRQR